MTRNKFEYELNEKVFGSEMARKIEEAMVHLDRMGFISHRVFPEEGAKRIRARLTNCDKCYGTGRFKGIGGPCSEGCPAKGGV